MGIPILRGRDFGTAERHGAPVAVIVNQTFATRFLPGEDPIGRRVSAMRIPEMQDMTIIGVVGDTRRGGALIGYTPEIYISFAQFPQTGATLVVRSASGDPLALANDHQSSRRGDRSHDADRQNSPVWTMRSRGRTATGARCRGCCRCSPPLALGLTVLGIASVVSFTVAQRIPEIGVRIALGARRADVVRLIVRNSLWPVFAGIAAGLLALVPLSRAYHSYLFGVSPADPIAIGAAVVLLLASAIAAAWVPAHRAAGTDPLLALTIFLKPKPKA